jgi:tetratricopeptide (TPR) repeat protein
MSPLDTLPTLERSGLVYPIQVEPELQYLFRHALIQEAGYTSILRTDRRKLHRVVAETIESAYPHRLEEFAGILAYHYDLAGEDKKTAEYLLLAAEGALKQFAVATAQPLFEQAEKLARAHQWSSELGRACGGLGEVYRLNGESAKSLAAFNEAIQNTPSANLRGYYFTQMGFTQHLNLYDFPAALENYQQAEKELLSASDPAKLGRLYTHLGYYYAIMPIPSDPNIGLDYLKRACDLLEPTHFYNDLAFAYAYAALYHQEKNQKLGLEWGARALDLCRRYNLPEPGEPAAIAMAHAYRQTFELEKSLAHYDLALEYNRSTGYVFSHAITQSHRARILLGMGKFNETLESLLDAEIHWRKLGHPNAIRSIKPIRSIALRELGQIAAADRELEEAFTLDSMSEPKYSIMIEVYVLMDRLPDALEIINKHFAEFSADLVGYLKTNLLFVRLRQHPDFPRGNL